MFDVLDIDGVSTTDLPYLERREALANLSLEHRRIKVPPHWLNVDGPTMLEVLSREQVYRLVTQPPQRLSMDVLVALCDILGCTPNDLIEAQVVNQQVSKTAGGGAEPTPIAPRRTVVRRPGQ